MATSMLVSISLLSWIALADAATAPDRTGDQIHHLPGLALDKEQCWRSFSGYLNVSGNSKQLFYWYHEATSDPSSKPLLLWLNGGPGCSSLGGMFTEHGPYVVDENLNVTLNPHSWNKVANVLYLEQPAGVGFSHPLSPSGTTDDNTTAADTYEALLQFMGKRPELKGRPFYVAGESYGGHYVPNTVRAVQEGNLALPSGERINLRGFAVGNGYTDWELDFNANVENGRFHALTSQDRFENARDACEGNYVPCFWPRPGASCSPPCAKAVHEATKDAMDGSIDIYDIYVDVCLDKGQSRDATQEFMLARERRRAIAGSEAHRSLLGATVISPIFPTCIDNYAARFLNQAKVQRAIGVEPATVPGGRWADCSTQLNYTFNYESELPNYRRWVRDGELEILIYNGDADFILSHMGNSAWVRKGLQLPTQTEWRAWRGSDGQVAGYFEQFKTAGNPLTYLTVKGAGHMVPRDRPLHALDMITSFLNGGKYGSEDTSVAAVGDLPPPLCGELL